MKERKTFLFETTFIFCAVTQKNIWDSRNGHILLTKTDKMCNKLLSIVCYLLKYDRY